MQKQINEIRKTIQDAKEEFNKDIATPPQKKNRNPREKSSLCQIKIQLKTTLANWNKWNIRFQGFKKKD
jgi:hypothetical protein